MIHTTVGLYANGEFKINGVPSDKLARHIKYNMNHRWGRGFFLDGICIHKGYLDSHMVHEMELMLESDPKYKALVDTGPYA